MCSLCSPPTNDVHDMFVNAAHQGGDAGPGTDSFAPGAAAGPSEDTDLHSQLGTDLDTEGYHFDVDSYHFDAPTLDGLDDGGFAAPGHDFF